MLRHKKQFIYFIILAIFLASFFALNVYSANLNSEYLRVSFFDVGQGDSVLIQAPSGKDILIDGGPDQKVIGRLNETLPFYDKYIDMIIITHPHADHIAGLIKVLDKYQVGTIYYNEVDFKSSLYLQLIKKINDKNFKLVKVNKLDLINLEENINLELINPIEILDNTVIKNNTDNNSEDKNVNNTSLVAKLIYKEDSFLFAGDAENEEENLLMQNNFDLEADVFKISHHGSPNANSQGFLQTINPDIAIISVGTKNKFGHPSMRVLKKIERAGAKIYRTDINGTIKIISNGNDDYKIFSMH